MPVVNCVRCDREIVLGESHVCSKADLARAARKRHRDKIRDERDDDDELVRRSPDESIGDRLARGFAMLDDDASLGDIYDPDELP